jgi:KDO2-lipid IV(A) lauroyltransferase
MTKAQRRHIAHRIEGASAWLMFKLFGLLPLDASSALGGLVAQSIGPHLGATKRARINLRRALPTLSDGETRRVIRRMWNNVGRVVAEYAHLGEIDAFAPDSRIELVGAEMLQKKEATKKRYIFFSAHYGNWEIATIAAVQAGYSLTAIYRAINNPIVDRLIKQARDKNGSELIPKGAIAARGAVGALLEGRSLCLLVDQKMNDGIPVPFFGRDAMTAPALARLALRYECICIPIRVVRTRGANFRLFCEPPLPVPRSGDVEADTMALMSDVNATVERWVRERPDQWFGWLHRRWPD